jgi:hypothetical protein
MIREPSGTVNEGRKGPAARAVGAKLENCPQTAGCAAGGGAVKIAGLVHDELVARKISIGVTAAGILDEEKKAGFLVACLGADGQQEG